MNAILVTIFIDIEIHLEVDALISAMSRKRT